MWGVGYRFTRDKIGNTFSTSLIPDHRTDDLYSVFVQDEIAFLQEAVRLTIGSKFEHNNYTGVEVQPNVRLLWTPNEQHTLWTAVSRAVRVPSRAEEDLILNGVIPPSASNPLPTVTSFQGDDNVKSENLLAYELGYRVQPKDRVHLDIVTFFNVYNDLVTFEPGVPFVEASPLPQHLVLPFISNNKMDGKTYGIELATDWLVLDEWRLTLVYSFLRMDLDLDGDSGSAGLGIAEAGGKSPRHRLSFRSSMDLPEDVELDFWVRYVDELPFLNIESYVTLDVRLGWKPLDNLELSIVGQNLFDNRHPEFVPEFIQTRSTETRTNVYGKVAWSF